MTKSTSQLTLKPTDAAYIAGLIDGEGTVTLTRKHRNEFRQLVVTISSTERCLLEYVKATCGVGKITNKRISQPGHTPSFTYSINNRQAYALLQSTFRYLRSYKRLRAQTILADYLELTPRNGKYNPKLLEKKSSFEAEVLGIKANGARRVNKPQNSLLQVLAGLEPLDEDFPDIEPASLD